MKRFISVFLALFIPCVSLFADYNRFGLPDSSEIRRNLRETWFEAPLSAVRMNRPEIRTNMIGERFQVRLEETEDYFSILVAPYARIAVDVYSDQGKTTEVQDIYPGDAPGGWILVRDKKTEKPIKIIYYFSPESDVFVQFFPSDSQSPAGFSASSNSSFGDFVIYNCYAARGVLTGIPFERFYSASFAEITKWTEKTLPWKYAEIYTDSYHSSLQMANVIREKLPEIVIQDDSCYDENFNPVYITTGRERKISDEEKDKIVVSGAGFLKWIADGIVEPITGGYLKREPLLRETVNYKSTGFQGILSENYNISFTLDWTRNLASALVSIRTRKDYSFDQSGVDVKIEPFASEFTEKGIQNLAGFVPDSGYSVKYLKPLLYVLSVTAPETFYFAAIRESDRSRSPEVQVFNSCAVFFPYIDSSGRFDSVVFKDGEEISLDDFCSRYRNENVFLTRALCTEQFYPVSFENPPETISEVR